jgi:hypothetical protein
MPTRAPKKRASTRLREKSPIRRRSLAKQAYSEADLRDVIARNVGKLEPGLELLTKEKYIPNELGTKSFIDLYARDARGHHVLIELKKSDASAREALHEILKYVEGVKRHIGVRDHEVRVLIASTEWKELLVPYSRFVSESTLAITGLRLHVSTNPLRFKSDRVDPIPFQEGRFLSPWHDFYWYETRKKLDAGLNSLKKSATKRGARDYVIVEIAVSRLAQLEHRQSVLDSIAEVARKFGSEPKTPRIPLLKYIAYVAHQGLDRAGYLEKIKALAPAAIKEEVKEVLPDLEGDEALHFLHEHYHSLDPRPSYDFYEIGTPAKFSRLSSDSSRLRIRKIHRSGTFDRNALLTDADLVSELCGETGATGQRFRRRIDASNPAHMASARRDITDCLSDNPSWRITILQHLDEIESEYPDATIEASIYNPCTGVFSIYNAITRPDGILYVPTYSLIVLSPDPIRMYYGMLGRSGTTPRSLRSILRKFYDGDMFGLLFTLTWGGYESRDAEVIAALGLAYMSFRCDRPSSLQRYYILQNGRWKTSKPVAPFSRFQDYLSANEVLVRSIVDRISKHRVGPMVMMGDDHENH